MDFLNFIFKDFNIYSVVIRLLLAALAGGLIGGERGRHGRAAGLRTHIVVCIGAAMTSLTSLFLSFELGFNGDVARLSAQVISGIGFLCAGTILIRNSSVITGLTTAAGIWTTAAIGIALGYGFYIGPIIATVIAIISFTVLGRFEQNKNKAVNIYIEVSSAAIVNEIVAVLKKNPSIVYDITPAKSGICGNVGIISSVGDEKEFEETKKLIKAKEETVIFVTNINQ